MNQRDTHRPKIKWNETSRKTKQANESSPWQNNSNQCRWCWQAKNTVKFDSQALNKITLMSISYGVNAPKVPNHTWSGQGFFVFRFDHINICSLINHAMRTTFRH
jgi:hypothetical protein